MGLGGTRAPRLRLEQVLHSASPLARLLLHRRSCSNHSPKFLTLLVLSPFDLLRSMLPYLRFAVFSSTVLVALWLLKESGVLVFRVVLVDLTNRWEFLIVCTFLYFFLYLCFEVVGSLLIGMVPFFYKLSSLEAGAVDPFLISS